MQHRAAVIVSTYNQARYLHLVLLSLRRQSASGFEVIVADDGSGPETAEVVSLHRGAGCFPLKHVWHEDDGFRKTVILNEAVKAAEAEVLVFTDGDCLAHPRFVESHLALARPGSFVVGRTSRLSRRLTEGVTEEAVATGRAQRMSVSKILDSLVGDSRKMEFGFYLGGGVLFRLAQGIKRNLELWGGNFSCFKSDYVRVNGFNEEFIGWGKEDLDLGARFRNLGLTPVSAANRAINFHLWHPKPQGRSINVPLQNRIRQEYRESGEYYCPKGYDGH